jgi:hypothetical protein
MKTLPRKTRPASPCFRFQPLIRVGNAFNAVDEAFQKQSSTAAPAISDGVIQQPFPTHLW